MEQDVKVTFNKPVVQEDFDTNRFLKLAKDTNKEQKNGLKYKNPELY